MTRCTMTARRIGCVSWLFVATSWCSICSARATTTTNKGSNSKKDEDDPSCQPTDLVPPLDPTRVTLLQQDYGVQIEPLHPMGAAVTGLDLGLPEPPADELIEALEEEMASRGFCVFKGQSNLTVDQLLSASEWWGGMELHSTHGIHPATPDRNHHIFRLSNDPQHGIVGVGPQWHNDGSFVSGTFSHVGYHMVRVPEHGGGTHFSHQGAAYDALSPEQQAYWGRLTSVNSNSGVLHPVVHTHPVSNRQSVWLHLGMTGAVIEATTTDDGGQSFRLLSVFELKRLMNEYNALLNQGFDVGYSVSYEYEPGDVIFIDNLAVAHRAAPESHQSAAQQGLRIVHRTTVRAMQDFPPDFGLPQYMDIYGAKPYEGDASAV